MTTCRRWSDHVWVAVTTWNYLTYYVCENCRREAPVQDWELP
jgi:hypothetical protein